MRIVTAFLTAFLVAVLAGAGGGAVGSTSAGGGRLVYVGEVPGANGYRIALAPASGGKPALLAHDAHELLYATPSPDGRLIAFGRQRGGADEVWVMRRDGTHKRRLAAGAYPTWAPDGRTLAFVADQSVMAVAADGTGLRLLFTTAPGTGGPWAPAWSPNGAWVAFQVFEDGLWAVRPDGSDGHRVATASASEMPGFTRVHANYDWSPDGTRLAYVAYLPDGSGAELFTTRVEGEAPLQLTKLHSIVSSPDWSPDGRRIAVWRTGGGAVGTVALVPASGGTARKVTAGWAPRWSPDGKIIAVLTRDGIRVVRPDGTGLRKPPQGRGAGGFDPPTWIRGGGILMSQADPLVPPELFSVRPDGSGRRRITHNLLSEHHPSWSPDGRLIAFSAGIVRGTMGEGLASIYIVKRDGTGLRRLTKSARGDDGPSWSPDGGRIVFSRGDDLYVLRLAGGPPRRIGGAATDAASPAWSPSGRWIAVDGIRLVSPSGRRGATITHPPDPGDGSAPDPDTQAAWAPGGRRLAFVRVEWLCPRCDEYSVWVADASGAHAHAITDGTAASWSPDATRLVASTSRGVVTMRPDGSDMRRVRGVPYPESGFDWGP